MIFPKALVRKNHRRSEIFLNIAYGFAQSCGDCSVETKVSMEQKGLPFCRFADISANPAIAAGADGACIFKDTLSLILQKGIIQNGIVQPVV